LKERKVGLDGTIRSNKLRSRHKKKSKHEDGPFVKSCAKFNKIKLIKGRDICSLKMRLEISLLVRINSVINSV